MKTLLMLVLVSLLVMVVIPTLHTMRVVPTCAEDVVIIGTGNFIRGRWTTYTCGPAVDDMLPARVLP